MQKLGKNDVIILTHVGGSGQMLHRTPTGYQFGIGPDAQIVTSVDQLTDFESRIVSEVSAWLNQGGVEVAQKARMEQEVSDAASELPGTLDALAEKLGPDVKAALFNMMKQAIAGGGIGPNGEKTEALDGGNRLISRPGQPKEFVPADTIGEDDEKDLVHVGAGDDGADEDSMSGQLVRSNQALKRGKRK